MAVFGGLGFGAVTPKSRSGRESSSESELSTTSVPLEVMRLLVVGGTGAVCDGAGGCIFVCGGAGEKKSRMLLLCGFMTSWLVGLYMVAGGVWLHGGVQSRGGVTRLAGSKVWHGIT